MEKMNRIYRAAAGIILAVSFALTGCGGDDGATYIFPEPKGPKFNYPSSVVAVNATDLYVADTTNHTIRKVVIGAGTATVSTIAGKAGVSGTLDDPDGLKARFHYPFGITTDGTYLYVADTYNHAIRRIELVNGNVTTLAGTKGTKGYNNAIGTAALFYRPFGIAWDGTAQKLYVADTYNHVIRTVDLTAGPTYGNVGFLAGTPETSGYSNGAAATAKFAAPIGVATDGSGTAVYVGDTGNNEIRKIDIGLATVTSLAGDHTVSSPGSSDGTGATALFYKPTGLAFFGPNLFVADSYNHTIRQVVVATGNTTTLSGTATEFYHTAKEANQNTLFRFPQAIATWDGATLYVADTYGHILRKLAIGPPNTLSILVGVPLVNGSADGVYPPP